ncbi:MAG: NAD-dependent epimerase/dehydratase family protein [Caulobacteraceae bacterium]|nr:NAD-dependent epimerase/dehydratase family protein [Caulobacteraceae bacterium]
MPQTALVSGGSGFVASHLIQQLLAAGDTVHTTVRSLGAAAKVAPLLELQKAYPGKLQIFEADLLKPGSFDAAMKGCDVVYHVASPFLMPEQIKDGRTQMLEPALQGTHNVLASVEATPTVRRVVLTSTVGAIFGDYIDVLQMEGQVLSEKYFNTTSSVDYNAYHYSKVVAEQEAWRICGLQNRWDMVSINPGLILGPSLTPTSESGSLFLLDELLKGYFFYGVPDLGFTTVDVRDVAQAHIAAAKTPKANGRYIVAEKTMISFIDMARILRKVHKKPYLLPRFQAPTWLIRPIAPLFGLTPIYIKNHFGIRFAVDNQRSLGDLGLRYRPIAETLIDHYRSWAARQAK